MQLNHFDLAVPDLTAAAAFFEHGFSFRTVSSFDGMRILVGEGGFVLALSHDEAPQYPASFHIGFLQPSRAAVSDTYERLRAAGIAAAMPTDAYGAFIFHCQVPGGVPVEVAYRPGSTSPEKIEAPEGT
jgi:catechol 2,3-dioxygenase-like lactoylglutathione lyase family enzyme